MNLTNGNAFELGDNLREAETMSGLCHCKVKIEECLQGKHFSEVNDPGGKVFLDLLTLMVP